MEAARSKYTRSSLEGTKSVELRWASALLVASASRENNQRAAACCVPTSMR
jgi:hypothetical protein